MVFAMIFSTMPAMAFAVDGEQAGEETFNPTKYVKAEDVFSQIKGANASMDNITTDLVDDQVQVVLLYANVDPTTHQITKWHSNAYGCNVMLSWVKSSEPAYIGVNKTEAGVEKLILKLRKRPIAANNETAKNVTLTMKLTGVGDNKNCDPTTLDIPLTITPGEKVKTSADKVKEGLFDYIKGENKDAAHISSKLAKISNGITYVNVKEDGSLSAGYSTYYTCKIDYTSSRPEIINASTGEVTQPEKDTQVTLTANIYDKGTGLTEKFDMKLTVLGKAAPAANVLDVITADLIFDAIKGENKSKDEITSSLTKPEGTNSIDDFYAVLNKDGTFQKWYGGRVGAKANIELKSISDNTILKKDTDCEKIDIISVPAKDTVVTVTFTITEIGNNSNTKEVQLQLTVKAVTESESLKAITADSIFEAIKGDNLDSGNIYSALKVPARCHKF